jgi:hypothetical protein
MTSVSGQSHLNTHSTPQLVKTPEGYDGLPEAIPPSPVKAKVQHPKQSHQAKKRRQDEPFTFFKGAVVAGLATIAGMLGVVLFNQSRQAHKADRIYDLIKGVDENVSSKQGPVEYLAMALGITNVNPDNPAFKSIQDAQALIRRYLEDDAYRESIMKQMKSMMDAGTKAAALVGDVKERGLLKSLIFPKKS